MVAASPEAGRDEVVAQLADLSLVEFRQIAAVVEGRSDLGLVRRSLWANWGLCPRHTWWTAVTEIELRGTRLGTVMWCSELIDRATAQLTLPWVRPRHRLDGLRTGGTCYVCRELACSTAGHLPAGTTERLKAARTNSRAAFGRLVYEGRQIWEPRSCPDCLGGDGPPCRRHLLERSTVEVEEVAARLCLLGAELDQLLHSMSWQAGAPDASARWSWIDALGWLGGWGFAAAAGRGWSAAEGRRSSGAVAAEGGE